MLSGRRSGAGLAILEILAVLLTVAALVSLTAPKFIHMKSIARKQALGSIAVQIERSSRFIRANAYLNGILEDTDRFYVICFNKYESPKCNRQGYAEDIVSTDMVLVQRGFPYVAVGGVLAPVSMLGYRFESDSYTSLKYRINSELNLFETCGSYCNLADLTSVCTTDVCIQDSMQGALIFLNGMSASEQCYVRYLHSGGMVPEIEVVSSGC